MSWEISQFVAALAGHRSYDAFRESHKKWVNESLGCGNNVYDEQWTGSIAVGSEQFAETIKARLRIKAMGRQVREVPGGYALREEQSSYNFGFDPQKGDIGLENTYNWCSFH